MTMEHKILVTIEWIFAIFLLSSSNPAAIVTSIIMGVYFLSKMKLDVVNTHYGGSWVKYIKSFFKLK